MRVFELFDDDDAINEAKQRLDPKCWTGYKKQGTKMKGGVRVNNCVPVEEENKGLYYNVNKRKKAGTSRPAGHPKAPTAQAWKDAAKTAKNESMTSGIGGQSVPARPQVKAGSLVKAIGLSGVWRVNDIRNGQADITQEIPNSSKSMYIPVSDLRVWTNKPVVRETEFTGYWKGTDKRPPGKHMVGANEAVNLDRSKNAQYPNDPATQKHRLDTAKRLLSDPKTDPDSRREAAAIIARMEPKGKA